MAYVLITSPLRGLRKNFPSAWRSSVLLSILAFYLGFIWWKIPVSVPDALSLIKPEITWLEVALMLSGAAGACTYCFKPKFGYGWMIGVLYFQWVLFAVLGMSAILQAGSNNGKGATGVAVYTVVALWSLDTAVDVTRLRKFLLGKVPVFSGLD
jgi:hypothetical protein